MDRPDDIPITTDAETRRLQWVQRNTKRRVVATAQPIGQCVERELSPQRLRRHAERGQLEAAVLRELDEELRGLVHVEGVRYGALVISVDPPLATYDLRLRWEQRLLQAIRVTRAGRGLRMVRFRRSEP